MLHSDVHTYDIIPGPPMVSLSEPDRAMSLDPTVGVQRRSLNPTLRRVVHSETVRSYHFLHYFISEESGPLEIVFSPSPPPPTRLVTPLLPIDS